MPNLNITSQIKLYADDTLLVHIAPSIQELTRVMQADLNVVSNWCNRNSLTINGSKSNVMLISQNEDERLPLSIGGVVLDPVPTYKYLGITLDEKATFVPHGNAMLQSIRHKLWIVLQVRKYLDMYTSIRIMKTMVMPYFDYGLVFTTGLSPATINKLHVYYNTGIRICINVKDPRDIPVKTLYTTVKMLPIDLRRIYLQVTMCHRLVYNGKVLVRPYSGTRSTEAPCMYRSMPKSAALIKDPIYQAQSQWNDLDPALRWVTNKNAFKCQIKHRLFAYFHTKWRPDQPQLIHTNKSIIADPVRPLYPVPY